MNPSAHRLKALADGMSLESCLSDDSDGDLGSSDGVGRGVRHQAGGKEETTGTASDGDLLPATCTESVHALQQLRDGKGRGRVRVYGQMEGDGGGGLGSDKLDMLAAAVQQLLLD